MTDPDGTPTGTIILSAVAPSGASNRVSPGSPDGVGGGFMLEATRANIAYGLLAILLLVVLAQVISSAALSGGCWVWGSYCPQAKEALTMISGATSSIFTAMVGLVGSVVGFYFGSKSETPTGGRSSET